MGQIRFNSLDGAIVFVCCLCLDLSFSMLLSSSQFWVAIGCGSSISASQGMCFWAWPFEVVDFATHGRLRVGASRRDLRMCTASAWILLESHA